MAGAGVMSEGLRSSRLSHVSAAPSAALAVISLFYRNSSKMLRNDFCFLGIGCYSISRSIIGDSVMKRFIFLFSLALMLTGMAFSAGQNDTIDVGSGQVLHVIHPVLQENWSPLLGGGHGARWQSFMWAAPLYFDKYGILHPFVLSRADADKKFMNWTLSIDPKAVFSDGSPITAEDIKGTWNLCARPGTNNARIDQFLGGVVGFSEVSQGKVKDMSGIVVKDRLTLIVSLSNADPIFDKRIATALLAPVKISQAEDEQGHEIPGWWNPAKGVLVTGPFMPESMDLSQGVITLIPNPHFFGPAPKLSKVVITTVQDAAVATQLLKTGKMDAHTELITPTIIQDLGADFINGPPLSKGQHFWFDAHKPPLDDLNVRKALIMCIDPVKMAHAAYPDGPFIPAGQILNKVPGVDPSFTPFPYDPEGAVKALAVSQYRDPRNLPPIIIDGISTPTHKAAAQYLAEQWYSILGIEEVKMESSIETGSSADLSKAQIFRDDVGTRVPDAVSYLMGAIYSGSANAKLKMGGYTNTAVDSLLEQAEVKDVNDPERTAMARRAQKLFRDEWMYIPYYYDVMSKWAMPWVQNFDKNDDWQVIEPWNVSIDESKRP